MESNKKLSLIVLRSSVEERRRGELERWSGGDVAQQLWQTRGWQRARIHMVPFSHPPKQVRRRTKVEAAERVP